MNMKLIEAEDLKVNVVKRYG